MVKALLIVDKKAWALLGIERGQARPFATLFLQFYAAAHHFGHGQAGTDFVKNLRRKAHDIDIARKVRDCTG